MQATVIKWADKENDSDHYIISLHRSPEARAFVDDIQSKDDLHWGLVPVGGWDALKILDHVDISEHPATVAVVAKTGHVIINRHERDVWATVCDLPCAERAAGKTYQTRPYMEAAYG
jgi:hypothetical protein